MATSESERPRGAEAAPVPALGRGQLVAFTAVALGLGLLLVLLLAEGALRLSGRRPAYLDAEMYVATGDARGYGLRPGYRGLYAGGRVSVGPLGLRGPARPGGVLLLGDSAGFGQGLDDDQTLAARLQALLAAKADGAAPPTVTNAGVPGYNTTTELAQLKVLLPQLRPRQVVLLYVVDNDTDLRPGVWVKEDGSLDLHLPTGILSRVSRQLTRHLVTYAELRGLVQIRKAQLVQAQEQRTPFAADDPGWRASRQALSEMRDLLGQARVPFAVGGIGLVENLGGVGPLEEACRDLSVPYRTLWRTGDVGEFVRRHAVSRTDSHAGAAATAEMAQALLPLLAP